MLNRERTPVLCAKRKVENKMSAICSWNDIKTVLLDVDGTLLDLHFDNSVWDNSLPEAFARKHNLSMSESRSNLYQHMRKVRGKIEFYSFDYWASFTKIDIERLHELQQEKIAFRKDAEWFLSKISGKRATFIATNADRKSFGIKDTKLGLTSKVKGVFSSQDFQSPKEEQAFWSAVQNATGFEGSTTLMIDDNEKVLEAAASYGIKHLRFVETPDSQKGTRHSSKFIGINNFVELFK